MKEPASLQFKRASPTPAHWPIPAGGGVKSVEVAGRLLQALGTRGDPVALHELAALSGMPASKAHRYLVSLIKIGLVEQSVKDRRYALGRFAIELGAIASRLSDPLSESIETTKRLRERIDETLTLSIWSATGPIVLHVEESSRPIVMTMRRGTVLPLLTTATGVVFCATLPLAQTDSLIQHDLSSSNSPRPIVASQKELDLLLAKVRTQGYALNSGHLLPDVIALAAPIYDRFGGLTAVLAVFGREGRIDPSRDPTVLKALLEATQSALTLHR